MCLLVCDSCYRLYHRDTYVICLENHHQMKHDHVWTSGGPRGPLLTQRSLLQQVQVAGEEVAPQRVVQVEGHAVATHGRVRLFPPVPAGLMSYFVRHVGRWGAVVVFQGNLHGGGRVVVWPLTGRCLFHGAGEFLSVTVPDWHTEPSRC